MDRPEILKEREKTHGPFDLTAAIAQTIKNTFNIPYQVNKSDCCITQWENISYRHREVLDMMATKIARILAGGPHREHFKDIAGYAELGSEACEEKS